MEIFVSNNFRKHTPEGGGVGSGNRQSNSAESSQSTERAPASQNEPTNQTREPELRNVTRVGDDNDFLEGLLENERGSSQARPQSRSQESERPRYNPIVEPNSSKLKDAMSEFLDRIKAGTIEFGKKWDAFWEGYWERSERVKAHDDTKKETLKIAKKILREMKRELRNAKSSQLARNSSILATEKYQIAKKEALYYLFLGMTELFNYVGGLPNTSASDVDEKTTIIEVVKINGMFKENDNEGIQNELDKIKGMFKIKQIEVTEVDTANPISTSLEAVFPRPGIKCSSNNIPNKIEDVAIEVDTIDDYFLAFNDLEISTHEFEFYLDILKKYVLQIISLSRRVQSLAHEDRKATKELEKINKEVLRYFESFFKEIEEYNRIKLEAIRVTRDLTLSDDEVLEEANIESSSNQIS